MSAAEVFDMPDPSREFMLTDLSRSGLAPQDFRTPPHPLAPVHGTARYRIPYPDTGYSQERFDRNERKYLGPPGVPTELYWVRPRSEFVGARAAAIVEGVKKAVLFQLTSGIPTIGLHSCNGGLQRLRIDDPSSPRQIRPELVTALNGDGVKLILLDGDYTTTPQVGAALATLDFELTCSGVRAGFIALPDGLGYDDWFIRTYGSDRAKWPSQEDVRRAVLMLPRVDVNALIPSASFMVEDEERYNEGLCDFSDRGLGTWLLRLRGAQNVRYLTDTKQWSHWSVERGWRMLAAREPLEFANRVAQRFDNEAKRIESLVSKWAGNDKKRDAWLAKAATYRRQANRASSNATRKNILQDVAARESVQCRSDDFDHDPCLLAVAGGKVVDLRTGAVRDERQDDMIIKRCTAAYDGTEPTGDGAQRMRRFLSEITADANGVLDPELQRYLQWRTGKALRGRNELQSLEIWVGNGSNGKSLLAKVLQAALGPYAGTTPPNLFLTSRNPRTAEAATPFMKHALPLRLAFMSETRDTDHLDAATLKMLTGGDKVAARGNYADAGEYDSAFTPILLTNSLPNIAQADRATWDRLHPIPFRRRWRRVGVEDSSGQDMPEADPGLDTALKTPGALAYLLWWAVRGGLDAQRELPTPACVRELTAHYREEQDGPGRWLAESPFELSPGDRAIQSDAYSHYREWCAKEGSAPVSNRLFGTRVRERFPQLKPGCKSDGKTYIEGLKRVDRPKY